MNEYLENINERKFCKIYVSRVYSVPLFEAYTRDLNGNYYADSVAGNVSGQRLTLCLTIDAFKIESFWGKIDFLSIIGARFFLHFIEWDILIKDKAPNL